MTLLQLESATVAPWGRPLLEGVSLSLEPGEIVALTGPNGAGKSTLLRTIAGDLPLDSGQLRIAGRDPGAWPRRALARRLACLPQLSLLNFPYTVEEVVALGRIPHDGGAGTDREVVDAVLAATDTTALRERLYTRLSGGERQRVQLARVFAQVWGPGSPDQRLLLLDEPTSALDLFHQELVSQSIRHLARNGCAVVLAVHDLNLASGIADRLAVLLRGRPVAIGTPTDVITEELLRAVFGVEMLVGRHPGRDQPMVLPR